MLRYLTKDVVFPNENHMFNSSHQTLGRKTCRNIHNGDKHFILIRQIVKAWVESQPIVTNEATLQLTIPALFKSSTKDLKEHRTYDERMVYKMLI